MTQPSGRAKAFDDLIKEFAPGFFVKPPPGDAVAPGQIRLDVRENEQAFTVLAEVPGVPKEQIDVSIDGSVVTLRGHVHSWAERQAAEGATWSAPGVSRVNNQLTIEA